MTTMKTTMSEGRLLEGSERDFWIMILSGTHESGKLKPFKVDLGTHCSDEFFDVSHEFPENFPKIYILNTSCGEEYGDLTIMNENEYKWYNMPYSEKFAEMRKEIERNKPIPVPEYIGKPIQHTTLEGILDKFYEDQDGAARIARERRRQKEVEGWFAEADDLYVNNELIDAAMQYLGAGWISCWPDTWDLDWYKPSEDDRIRDLEKAGALIAAEIDRLKRQRDKNGRI